MSDGAITQTKSWPRFIETVLVFALAGPVIGGGIAYLALFTVLELPVIGLLYTIAAAILPMFIAGFVIAVREYFRGRTSVWFAAAVGLQAGLIAAAVYWWWLLGWSSNEAIWIGVVWVVSVSILASVVCWWLARPRLPLIDHDI